MLYRPLNDMSVSILGFGAIRLPFVGGTKKPTDSFDPNRIIDEEETARMIDYAINHGVNYFDTAYTYHEGRSGFVLGKMLESRRNSIIIATKLPVFLVNTREDFDRFLDEQLQRLHTSYLDFHLLHGLNEKTWERSKALGVLAFLDRARKDGRVRRAGFSFHDTVSVFKNIIEAYDWACARSSTTTWISSIRRGQKGLSMQH